MRKRSALILALCGLYAGSASAFFCFLPGGDRNRVGGPRGSFFYPPPPPPMYLPAPAPGIQPVSVPMEHAGSPERSPRLADRPAAAEDTGEWRFRPLK